MQMQGRAQSRITFAPTRAPRSSRWQSLPEAREVTTWTLTRQITESLISVPLNLYIAKNPWDGLFLRGLPSLAGCLISPLCEDFGDSFGFHISSSHSGTVPLKSCLPTKNCSIKHGFSNVSLSPSGLLFH